MTLTLELTPDQIDALADAVAAKLANAKSGGDALTVAEAAKRLGVSIDTIYRRVEAGMIPKVPSLGVIRIPAAAIERMLSQEGREA